MATFGERLKELRKKNNLTQQQLAYILCLKRGNIAKWETKRAIPSFEIIEVIANYFEVVPDYLLGYISYTRVTSFSDKLKALRKEKKLTQKKIAELIGISQGSYANWENGKREPSLENVVKLANILNISIDYLLGRTSFDMMNIPKKH